MPVDRVALEAFLLKHAKGPAAVRSAMEEMEPFFLIAERGKYPLASESEELRAEAAKAIALAIGGAAPRVVFVSLANPYSKPERMSQEAYVTSLGDSLWASLWASIRASLGDRFWDSLGDRFRDSLGDSLWASLGDSLWASLGDSLFYYLGFTIIGDRKMVKRLTPLIRLLPRAIPIGEKKGEPGVWFAHVA